MFRIFLKKKLYSGLKDNKPETKSKTKEQNRRLYSRYAVDKQHLTVLNDQDILLIRDVSHQGFSSEVSERAFERFSVNDIFSARMRQHGEVVDIKIKVAWKHKKSVGFELYKPDAEALQFFRKLVRPLELASSLSPVDAAFMRDQHQGLIWYHGEACDLFIWRSDEEGMIAWQLIADNLLVDWSRAQNLRTGRIQQETRTQLGILEPGEVHRDLDRTPLAATLQFAADILAALPHDNGSELLKTLDDQVS